MAHNPVQTVAVAFRMLQKIVRMGRMAAGGGCCAPSTSQQARVNYYRSLATCQQHKQSLYTSPVVFAAKPGNQLIPSSLSSLSPSVGRKSQQRFPLRAKLQGWTSSVVESTKTLVQVVKDTTNLIVTGTVRTPEHSERLTQRELRQIQQTRLTMATKPKEPSNKVLKVFQNFTKAFDPPSDGWLEQRKEQQQKEEQRMKSRLASRTSLPDDEMKVPVTLTSFMLGEVPIIDSLEPRRGLYGTILPPSGKTYSIHYAAKLENTKQQKHHRRLDEEKKNSVVEGLKDRFVTPSRLRLQDLSFQTTPEAIIKWFSKFDLAAIERPVELIHYPDGRFSGMAYVSFSRYSEALRALQSMNQRWFHKRPIRMEMVQNPKEKPRIQRYPFHMINRAKKPEPHEDF